MGVCSKKEGNVCFTNDERVVLGHLNMFFFVEKGLRINCVFSYCLTRCGTQLKAQPYGLRNSNPHSCENVRGQIR